MAEPTRPRGGVPKVISHYRVGKLLGGGGMGEVYLATDRRDGSTVALKLLHPHLAHDEAFRERFEREAHVGALLRSPYTVHLLDHGMTQGHYFIVMEYVEGASLKEAMRGGALDVHRALRIAAQAARALEEGEARGVIHRDIKPDNIFVGVGDSVKVGDFGIARQVGGGTLTTPGAFVGTLAYAAPELALGKADHRSDIYSLGATLYHILTGRPPFQGDALEVLRHHQETPLQLEPLAGLPADAVEIITRCLEKDPEKRYQTASALAGALEHAAVPVPAVEPEAPMEIVAPPEDEAAAGPPADAGAVTQVVQPLAPLPEEPAPTEVKPREKPPAAGPVPVAPVPVSIELGPANGGGSLRPTRFALTLRNGGDQPTDVRLEAADGEGRCAFSLPKSVSVPAGSAKTVSMVVRPRSHRWRGARETREFTVSASGAGGGPPAIVTGSFEDVPYGWLPVGALLAAGVVPAAIAAALLLGGGGGDGDGGASLSDEDLGALVLTQADLGPDYASFTSDPGRFGVEANEDRLAGACDPDAVTQSIDESGRTGGYVAAYVSEDLRAAGDRAFRVSTWVDQYGNSLGAKQDLEAFMDSPVAGLGKPDCEDLAVENIEEFDPGAIGDASRGAQVLVSKPGTGGAADEFTLTIVGFVRGPLAGRVIIEHRGVIEYKNYAGSLAQKMDAGFRGALNEEQVAARTPKTGRKRTPSPGAGGSPGSSGTGVATQGTGATAVPVSTGGPGPANPPVTHPPAATPRTTAPPPTNPPPTQPPPPSAPSISSLGCPGSATVDNLVYCSPSVSGTVTGLLWDAPGGSPSSGGGGAFSTLYSSSGTKTITLTACNNAACSSLVQSISVSAPQPAYFEIYVGTTTVGVGESVTVDIYVQAPGPGLGAYDIDVDYDSSLVSATFCTYSAGGFCEYPYDGTVAFSGYSGLSGYIYLGSIEFTAGYSSGTTALTVYMYTFDDANGSDMTYSTYVYDGEVQVAPY